MGAWRRAGLAALVAIAIGIGVIAIARSSFGWGIVRTLGRRPCPGGGNVYDLVVVGAGISGLAAASRARARGLCVLVLEARQRIGGRTHTVALSVQLPPGAPMPAVVDLGAAWIHGTFDEAKGPNPLALLSQQAGVPVIELQGDQRVYSPEDAPAAAEEWSGTFYRMADAFVAFERPFEAVCAANASLQNAVEAFLAERHPSPLERQALLQFLHAVIVASNGDDPAYVTAPLRVHDSWGGPNGLPGRGYGALAAHLAAGVDVRLGHEVTAVRYAHGGGEPVSVSGRVYGTLQQGADGAAAAAGEGFTHRAQFVIVTLPLGYLQAKLRSGAEAPHLFQPPLPEHQLAAIQALGVGLLNKVVLVWKSAWWAEQNLLSNESWIVLRNDTEPGAFIVFNNVHATPARLPVLVCLLAASYARSVEALSDADTITRTLASLQRILPPGTAIPPPAQALVTRWGQDPWALGAYSYGKAGMRADARLVARQAVGGGRVGFAGEHTHEQYPSTVHGALLSGLREADRVADALLGAF